MLIFKGCPRCHGDLETDRDYFGAFVRCLQCGCYIQHASEQDEKDYATVGRKRIEYGFVN